MVPWTCKPAWGRGGARGRGGAEEKKKKREAIVRGGRGGTFPGAKEKKSRTLKVGIDMHVLHVTCMYVIYMQHACDIHVACMLSFSWHGQLIR